MGIIPLDNDLNTYLVDQWSYPLNAYSWEIPMGGGHLDGDSLGSAKREFVEETGIAAASWERLSKVHLSNWLKNLLLVLPNLMNRRLKDKKIAFK